jgi:hypothetical protein
VDAFAKLAGTDTSESRDSTLQSIAEGNHVLLEKQDESIALQQQHVSLLSAK